MPSVPYGGNLSRRIIRSLAIGLPFPTLFALYSVYLQTTRPQDDELRALAGIQAACLACASTAIVGLLALPLTGGFQTATRHLWRDRWNILWLIVFTMLGPPLYFIAIVLIGASPTNWIDLGLVPVLTFAGGLWIASGEQRPGTFMWFGAALVGMGLAIVVWEAAGKPGVSVQMIGVALACLSAVGTAGAGVFLQKIRDCDDPIPPSALLPIRYIVPTLILAAVWAVVGWRLETKQVVIVATPGAFVVALLLLNALPNYLYVVVIDKKRIYFLSFMWAMLPVIGSVAELICFGADKMSLSLLGTIVAGVLILSGTAISEIKPEAVDSVKVVSPELKTIL